MLPVKNRLKKRGDFQRVFKKGKGIKEDLLIFKWAPNNLKISRFGFVISKKVSKKAVLRNKIKRKLREKIRKELPLFKKGIDGVIIVKPGAAERKGQEIIEILNKIFFKAGLILKNEGNNL